MADSRNELSRLCSLKFYIKCIGDLSHSLLEKLSSMRSMALDIAKTGERRCA